MIVLALVLLPSALGGGQREPSPIHLSRRATRALLALIVGLWLAIYLPLLAFPFLSDDYVFLERYQQLTGIGEVWEFFRPAFAVVFWVLAGSFSQSPVPFHVLSLMLHFASACLVSTLAARLFAGGGQAILCFAVFLLNPLQLEAVLWVSGLQDQLWTFFVMAALVVYVGVETLAPTRLLVMLGLLALALLSKETAVCYVLLLPGADWLFFRANRGKWLAIAYGLFATELGVYLFVRGRFTGMGSAYVADPSAYFIKQFVTTPYRFFVQPWNLTVAHVSPAVLCASAAIAITLLFWTIAVRRSSHIVWIGAFVVLASTLPVYGYFFVREDLMAARYLYFAAGGWALIAATLIGSVVTRPIVFAGVVVSLALGLALSLHLNLRPWRVAAEVATLTRTELVEGRPAGELVTPWAARNGVELIWRGSIPSEFGGVGIFINGYDELKASVRASTSQ